MLLQGVLDSPGVSAILAYRPFYDALPIWTHPNAWALLLIPLCGVIAIVYKSIRCREMSLVPREATGLFLTILFGMILTAAALVGLAKILE